MLVWRGSGSPSPAPRGRVGGGTRNQHHSQKQESAPPAQRGRLGGGTRNQHLSKNQESAPPQPERRARPFNNYYASIAFTTSSVTFFASPNSIIVFGRKNSSFSTPAYPAAMPRLMKNTVLAFSTSRIGMP